MGSSIHLHPKAVQKAILISKRTINHREDCFPDPPRVVLFYFCIAGAVHQDALPADGEVVVKTSMPSLRHRFGKHPHQIPGSNDVNASAKPHEMNVNSGREMEKIDHQRTATSGHHISYDGHSFPRGTELLQVRPGEVISLQYTTPDLEIVERPYTVVSDIFEPIGGMGDGKSELESDQDQSSADKTSLTIKETNNEGREAIPCIRRVVEVAIKIYRKGSMSQLLMGLSTGSTISLRGPYTDTSLLNPNSYTGCWRRFGFIAAGTGITPCISLVRYHFAFIKKHSQTKGASSGREAFSTPDPTSAVSEISRKRSDDIQSRSASRALPSTLPNTSLQVSHLSRALSVACMSFVLIYFIKSPLNKLN